MTSNAVLGCLRGAGFSIEMTAHAYGQIKPGAIVVAGDEDTAAVCEVIDLAPAGDGTIVHLRLLPGLVEDYRVLVERALAS